MLEAVTLGDSVCPTDPPQTLCPTSSGYEDMEAQFAWDDKTIRQTFIRKVWLCFSREVTLVPKHTVSGALTRFPVLLQVYAILMVQLLVTVGIVALFSFW